MKRYQQYIMPVLCLIVVLAIVGLRCLVFFGIDLYVLPAAKQYMSSQSVRSSAPYGCIPW